MCLMNVLSFASADFESLSTSTNSLPSTHFEEPKSSHIDINILALSFHNIMARNNKNVDLYYNNQKDGVYLTPGQSYVKLDNVNGAKSAVMYWDGNCISFLAYDPNAEAGHQKIFWNIKEDVCLNLKGSVSANSLASTHKNDSNISPAINVMGISISH
ncbi:hypothetical protein ACSQ67_013468 [Phaseolus vulgaris]